MTTHCNGYQEQAYGRSFAKCLSVTCLTTSINKLWNPNQNCLLCPMQLTLRTHLITTNSRYYSTIEHTRDYHESLSSLPHKNTRVLYLYSWCTWILHLNTSQPPSPTLPPPCHSFGFFRIYTTASSLYLKVSQPGPCSFDGRFVPGVLLPVQEGHSYPEKGGLRKGRSRVDSQNRLHERRGKR